MDEKVKLLKNKMFSKLEGGTKLSKDEHLIFQEWADDNCLKRNIQSNAFRKIDDNTLIDLTADQIIETVKWRSEFKVKEINPVDLETAMRPAEAYLSPGKGKKGQAIIINTKSKEKQQYDSSYIRSAVYWMEKAIDEMKDSDQQQWIVLADIKNWGPMNRVPISIAMELIKVLQLHYRERLQRVYVLNSPLVFRVFWKLVSKLVEPDTREKIKFLPNTNPDSLWEQFKDDIDREQLQIQFGGDLEYTFNFDRDILGLRPSDIPNGEKRNKRANKWKIDSVHVYVHLIIGAVIIGNLLFVLVVSYYT